MLPGGHHDDEKTGRSLAPEILMLRGTIPGEHDEYSSNEPIRGWVMGRSRLGSQQKDMILFIGEKTGVKRFNPLGLDPAVLEEALDTISLSHGEIPASYLYWKNAAFLGRKPERKETASLARSLDLLEKKGFIKRRRKPGQSQRRLVRLTAEGAKEYRRLLRDLS